MRRRSAASSPLEQMEKGAGKHQHNRLCLLASLSAFFWILLLYFHFVVLGGSNLDESIKLESGPIYPESKTTQPVTQPFVNPPSKITPFSSVDNPWETTPNSNENTPFKTTLSSSNENVPLKITPTTNYGSPSKTTPTSSEDIPSKTSPSSNENVPLKITPTSYNEDTPSKTTPSSNENGTLKITPTSNNDTPLKTAPTSSENTPLKTTPNSNGNGPLKITPTSNNDTPSETSPTSSENSPSKTTAAEVQKVESFPFMRALRTVDNKSDPCGGRYIYVHHLPPKFNEDMLKECRSLSRWTNMCKFTTNAGLGPPLENAEGVFSNTGWYATNQFAVDVIFSNRMRQYECLTNDSSIAAAIFVPFYAGFDIARYLWGYNISTRDAASLELVDWLMKRPEWGIMQGRDHFLVAGRITWDFRRLSEEETDWGNKLLFLPAAKNMSMLVVESSPWNANDFGIPYPTYFHPAKDADVFNWQDRMRNLERKWLFSFAGAPRPDNPKSIRGQIIDQCKYSKGGKLLECDFGESKCHSPSSIMQMFQSSLFCLQPQGDSYTRRSAFDSMLAGCIPVFFHPGSAYTQYTWHLPKNYTTFSVFIPEDDIRKGNVIIEERLSQIPPEQVKMLRENVINLIPSLIYADPRSRLETLKDAFDVAVQAVIDKVTRLRKNIIQGRTEYDNFVEENSWKYELLEEGQREAGAHEWDPFFSKPKDGNSDSGASSADAAKKSWSTEQRDHS